MMQDNTEQFPLELVKEFVVAAHGDLERVQRLLAEEPGLLDVAYPWSETDWETAIEAAAHMGNRPIAEFLLAKGAPLNICTAAMLGRREEVARMLAEDPTQAQARGAHGIPLMLHVGLGGDTAVAEMILAHGEQERAVMNATLHMAVARNQPEMVSWLLDTGLADVATQNSQGKTALDIAREAGNEAMIALLQGS